MGPRTDPLDDRVMGELGGDEGSAQGGDVHAVILAPAPDAPRPRPDVPDGVEGRARGR